MKKIVFYLKQFFDVKFLKFMLAEDAFVHHFASVSFKKLGDDKYLETFNKNKKYFVKKWGAPWKAHKYRDGVN